MNNITRLQSIVDEGEAAQSQLNEIAEDIYNVYMTEIKTQKKALKTECPYFDERISELEGCYSGFHDYRISGDELILIGVDNFRGETNTEHDRLPTRVFIEDKEERDRLIKKFVTSKFGSIRNRIKKQQEQEEETERQQFEALKEKYEGTK